MPANVVAIDGPSGVGKSSAAKSLAQRLGFFYVDSGATYRALALAADNSGVDLNDPAALGNFLSSFKLRYAPAPGVQVSVDGVDYTGAIRRHEVAALASAAAAIAEVRRFLVAFQRRLAPPHGCVMEGRDIGTVVFPDALVKFFVTAPGEVRAKRRWRQMEGVDLARVEADQERRDQTDTQRPCDPLAQARDAILVDTGKMNLAEVVQCLEDRCRERGLHPQGCRDS